MKALFSFLLLILFSLDVFSQDNMVVDKPFLGTTYYKGHSEFIESTEKIPTLILINLNNLIKSLGVFSSEITFVQGQIVDLKKYFENDTSAYNIQWVVPKYDLNFKLCDTTLGLKNYIIQIRLDEYGQVLKMNWPRKDYTSRSRFISRDIIKKNALKQAAQYNFNLKDYSVELEYEQSSEKFFWKFKFWINGESKDAHTQYNSLEINWADADEYKISKWIVATVN